MQVLDQLLELGRKLKTVEARPQPQLGKVVTTSPLTVQLLLDAFGDPIGVDLVLGSYTPSVNDRVLLIPVQGQWAVAGKLA